MTNSEKDDRVWFALLILFAINTMNFFDRQVLAAVTEPIRKEWLLSLELLVAVCGADGRRRRGSELFACRQFADR